MKNFNAQTPTEILFGQGKIKELPRILNEYGKNILLVYGSGSIKKNGIYQEVIDLLNDNDFKIVELKGVDPNPRVTTVIEGAELCRKHDIDVILAVGGGSVIDCAKVIGAARYYEGNPWDFTQDRSLIKEVLPVVTILTIAATGSEMNATGVLTNWDTHEKISTSNWGMIPKASILDPRYTYTVPSFQTAAGSADILSHLIENYFSQTKGAKLQDRIAEGIMKTVIEYCPIALEDPENYEARANLMWSSTLALNGLTGNGKGKAWSCHAIEHELSAHYDMTHGLGLAIITPRWMLHVLNEQTVDQFVEFAVNVWNIPLEGDPFSIAKKGIQALSDTFLSWDLPMTLTELDIDSSKIREMAEHAVAHSQIETNAFVPLTVDDVEEILLACL